MEDDGFTTVTKEKVVKKQEEQPVEKPVEHLVLDTGPIISNINLHTLAERYYAPPEVIKELKSRKAAGAFDKLPFEVALIEPSIESMKTVIEASKKTGDFKSLSVVDMKVIALTYELHNRFSLKKTNTPSASLDEEHSEFVANALKEMTVCSSAEEKSEEENRSENGDGDSKTKANLPAGFCDVDDSDDEDGWITEDNLVDALKKIGAFEVEEGIKVGCLTTDFALQNVLLFMDLSLVSLSGYRIKKIRSYVLRCRACYSTTSNMDKEFCPSCGNKMLHKCAVSVDENGEQVLHINWRRLEVKRGLKHSIAAPKGGKHSMNEKLFEDQPMPQNRMAKSRADPFSDNPFAIHDTTSRSALLGIHTMKANTRRNPNESRGTRKKK